MEKGKHYVTVTLVEVSLSSYYRLFYLPTLILPVSSSFEAAAVTGPRPTQCLSHDQSPKLSIDRQPITGPPKYTTPSGRPNYLSGLSQRSGRPRQF
ncbi:hypothetical protein RRG08_013050 [Elysia crispata]|uniref:Uncharacterized protein n=1 Tax=Elysia crispata TaxID=231223 RepID=A0AAE1A0C7_9GAST|nr:hypothetical protein RRG08_013050 [Elysia crispata]